MASIHERILTILDEQKLSIAAFERTIGVGRNSISMALRKKSAIDHIVLKKINDKFPYINIYGYREDYDVWVTNTAQNASIDTFQIVKV